VLREALDVLIERYIKTYRLWATGGRLASDDGFSARAFRVILWEERRKLLREHASEAEYEERLMYHTNLMRRQQLDAHQRIELAEALAEARKRVTGKHNLSSWYALHYKAEGYRSREIAKVFGLSDAAVRKRISQSRLTLGASNDDVPSHTVAA
jgi:DNA-directed RNA polymerase specialized sigma24 family protein